MMEMILWRSINFTIKISNNIKKVIDVLKKESLVMKPCDISPIDKDWKKKYWAKVNLEIAAKESVQSA